MDDLISRQAAIDVVHKTIYGVFDIADDESEEPISDKDKLLLEINKAVCNRLKELPVVKEQPTADVRENVRGKWVFEDEYVDSDGIRHVFGEPHCSECNYQPYRPEDDRIDECTPYCPNCGADMRGEKHGL